MDGAVIGYVASDHRKFLLYCVMAAVASAAGSLIPYYVGRAGGELFLLKRINRARYERMRDRFANQEFLAIMIPAMMPPPMPIKLFEFGAGVFEMRPLLFATAVFSGKFIQFLVCALITVFYGPEIAHTFRRASMNTPTLCWRSPSRLGWRLSCICCASCSTGDAGRSFPLKRPQRRTRRRAMTTLR